MRTDPADIFQFSCYESGFLVGCGAVSQLFIRVFKIHWSPSIIFLSFSLALHSRTFVFVSLLGVIAAFAVAALAVGISFHYFSD